MLTEKNFTKQLENLKNNLEKHPYHSTASHALDVLEHDSEADAEASISGIIDNLYDAIYNYGGSGLSSKFTALDDVEQQIEQDKDTGSRDDVAEDLDLAKSIKESQYNWFYADSPSEPVSSDDALNIVNDILIDVKGFEFTE